MSQVHTRLESFLWAMLIPPLLLSMLGTGVASAQSTIARQDVWVPNGTVLATASTDDTIFLGGRFSRLGPYTGGLSAFFPTTGNHVKAFPQVNGVVEAILDDGAGGWYIGGEFQGVGGAPQFGISRIQADGLPTPQFNSTVFGRIHALHLDGEILYIGGDRLSVNGEPREGVAALHAHTGELLDFSPSIHGRVHAIATTEDRLFVGGMIHSVNGVAIMGLAVLDRETGGLTNAGFGTDGMVTSMAQDEAHIYVGGRFSNMGGQPRQNFAIFDAIDGTLIDDVVDCNDNVYAIAFNDDYLFLGGRFTQINGESATRVVALHRQSRALAHSYPIFGGHVRGLAALGGTLYVGGLFNCVADINCTTDTRNLVAFDIQSQALLPWEPNPSNEIKVLAANDTILLAGGNHVFLGGVERKSFAAIDMETGQPLDWTLDGDTSVNAMAVYHDRLYVSRRIGSSGPLSSNIKAYAIDQIGPHLWRFNMDGIPTDLAADNLRVYVAGYFDTIGNQARQGIAALSAQDGTVLGWNAQLDGPVLDVELKHSRLYLAGEFTAVQGVPAEGVAVLNALNGHHLSAGLSAGQPMATVTFEPTTQTIYATPPILESKVVRAWRYDPSTNGYSPIPSLANESYVYDVAAISGRLFVATSGFSLLDGRDPLRSYSIPSHELRTWRPRVRDPHFQMNAGKNALHIGGSFRGIGSVGPAFFAAFPEVPSAPNAVAIEVLPPLAPNASSATFAIRFDKPVVSFDRPQDVRVIHSGTQHDTVVIEGSGTYYVATLDGLSGDGAIQLSINTGWNVQDIEGLPLASSVVSEPIHIDRVEPSFSDIHFSQPIAQEGDMVFLAFDASESLASPPDVLVNGRRAEVVDVLSPQYLKDEYAKLGKGVLQGFDYVYCLEVGPERGAASISVVGIDLAGNVGSLTQGHGLYLSGNVENLPVRPGALALLTLVFLWFGHALRSYRLKSLQSQGTGDPQECLPRS